MKPTNMLLGLAPWVLFSMIAEHIGAGAVGLAALAACLGSLVLTVRGTLHGGLKLIDAAGVLTFGALAAVGFASGHQVRTLLVDYGRGGSALVLAAVMLVSAFTVPFTEQYARAGVDRRYWASPVFRALNRRISLLWSAVILVMALCHLSAGALQASGHGDTGNLLLNWVIPVLLILGGLKRSQQIATDAGVGATAGGRA
ncbi:hypothetical protein OG455_03685 [Kitasatospora sp. NBC_01287]|uniref:hypothetical protein n=1 Tax=Kitasatospora sp. NBC_01287 TaxID=2903573 RepID=UPI00224FDB32|nr:hypothetical protein [Kitasatospora sp. NBC_01287]MCX4744631.1 hypothetical protein [Kitasatospora sp. NBC_01287]